MLFSHELVHNLGRFLIVMRPTRGPICREYRERIPVAMMKRVNMRLVSSQSAPGEVDGPGRDCGALFARLQGELIGYARTRFRLSHPECEDMVQQSFARFAALKDPGEIANPRAYLYRLVHNAVIDYKRRAKTEQAAMELPGEDISRSQVDDLDPERVLSGKHSVAALREVLDTMPCAVRDALLLRRLEELSYVEIARRLNTSQTSAKRLVAEGLQICARKMREEI